LCLFFVVAHGLLLNPLTIFTYNQQNIKVGNCNVVESISQNVMRSIKDKGKLLVDEGSPSQIDLTLKIELGKTSKEIELEFKKRKKVYELK
jgi:hypothetical protein